MTKAIIRNFLFLALLSVLTACSGSGKSPVDQQGQSNKPNAPVEVQTPSGPIKIERTRSLDENGKYIYNQYKFKISLPSKKYVRARVLLVGEGIVNYYENYEDGSVTNKIEFTQDLPTVPLTQQVIRVSLFSQDEAEIMTQDFAILPDLIVKGKVFLSKLVGQQKELSLAYMIFEKDSVLVSEGVSVEISAQYLTAHNARIESYDPDVPFATPLIGMPGADGGEIRIVAQKAEGYLGARMRGKPGGPGHAGANSNQVGAPGSDGAAASAGQYCEPPVLSVPRGPIVMGGIPQRVGCQVICKAPPKPGMDGQPGGAGSPGQAGARGGKSGLLDIVVREDLGFIFRVSILPGDGGVGGEGGLGGPGGPGGQPGADPYKACKVNVAAGNPGRQGAKGQNGSRGADGERQISKIQYEDKAPTEFR